VRQLIARIAIAASSLLVFAIDGFKWDGLA
jgi:hypothetical protein